MNLEQQKKQARELLRALRAGQPDSLRRLRSQHLRWAPVDDAIIRQDVALHDAGTGKVWRAKTPSVPSDPSRAFLTGVRLALEQAGCGRVFDDVGSGSLKHRPQLDACLKFLAAGDTLVVWRLDRLGRGLKHLIEVVQPLHDREIGSGQRPTGSALWPRSCAPPGEWANARVSATTDVWRGELGGL